jgi:hypothetical protein
MPLDQRLSPPSLRSATASAGAPAPIKRTLPFPKNEAFLVDLEVINNQTRSWESWNWQAWYKLDRQLNAPLFIDKLCELVEQRPAYQFLKNTLPVLTEMAEDLIPEIFFCR